ncbi:strawberry notch family protein [Bartonella choladocola]|uniref:C-terminal domain of Strawberry notch protein n=1 Tax=Bartonella choladocola TaxID=2750995 RepID=A0A1U9MJT7_9HYPH|nr:strawberry notch family protein [Bartonella choladocola]AQT47979.1 C-terminal domain of Strawberry notch protein [Bartonella choladocola]
MGFAAQTIDTSAIPTYRRASDALFNAGQAILAYLEQGRKVEIKDLRQIMSERFGGSDTTGAWSFKMGYDACEIAQVLFLRKYGRLLLTRYIKPAVFIHQIEKMQQLLPTHSVRSDESIDLQQFSTPLILSYAASLAAKLTTEDLVLEPSAGNGLLAIFAELFGSRLQLNEYADLRKSVLERLFHTSSVTQYDGIQINDRLPAYIQPSIVLINPPFSSMINVNRRMPEATFAHINSSMDRLCEGGRLVAITGEGFIPSAKQSEFETLNKKATLRCSILLGRGAFAKHGTTVNTRLSIFDKKPDLGAATFIEAQSIDDITTAINSLPDREKAEFDPQYRATVSYLNKAILPLKPRTAAKAANITVTREDVTELQYETIEWHANAENSGSTIYEPYQLQSISIKGAKPHPDKIVQSVAMASVAPPKPNYHPHTYQKIIDDGILSDVQLETIIYAGEAHSHYLPGHWLLNENQDHLSQISADHPEAIQFRQGYQLGDGTGVGKGRQAAGIVLDNWLKGRQKAIWISKSEALIEDARRDWSALLMEPLQITPLSRFPYGTSVSIGEGILYTTYSTLRSEQKGNDEKRINQIVKWFGKDYDGVIILDESHALANAAPVKNEQREAHASQQGRVGLLLQRLLPNARIVYLSATSATDVINLAYAERLGLWGNANFPFHNRVEFVTMLDDAGVAGKEVFARDLKMLGLYNARSLSYEGVEYETVDHTLTDNQIEIYDTYAEAFQVIHNNLTDALEATNISRDGSSLARNAMSSARSAFESTKQRFFNHLIISMATPTLIKSIKQKLKEGFAPVIQIISTGEAVQERRLAEIPPSQWNDLQVDVTPREYVLQYLRHAFPVQLHEIYEDENKEIRSKPAYDENNNAVINQQAVKMRDDLLITVASLPAVPCALDQIIQYFGTDEVAEITGRSRRIIREGDVLKVQSRPALANLAETDAFMSGKKRILVFSEAGGTGRSYHADKNCKNQLRRYHYLLEPGWRADVAIQGLGRTHRTNQKHPPVFAPVVTNVKAQKRFISTISRRLDTLGAISKGQRQTAGQGLFRPEDNLESSFATAALYQLYLMLAEDKVIGCNYETFKSITGLKLKEGGTIKQDLPRIQTFLNRLLALKIHMQDLLFGELEKLLIAKVEGAKAAGNYDQGTEYMRGESFRILEDVSYAKHARTGAITRVLTIERKIRNKAISLNDILSEHHRIPSKLVLNKKSGHAALLMSAPTIMLDNGDIVERVMLQRPTSRDYFSKNQFKDTYWEEYCQEEFCIAWEDEIQQLPEYNTDQFKIVTGLLLPVWKDLPSQHKRIFLLQTDNNERIIGRRVPVTWASSHSNMTNLNPDQVFKEIQDGNLKLNLADDLEVNRVRFMHEYRIEVLNHLPSMQDRLRAIGLFSEIKDSRRRLFIPNDHCGPKILQELLKAYPVVSTTTKGA